MTNMIPDQILIQDSRGRVRTPKWRQEALLAEHERSGMSGAAFAAHHGIKYQTFATWKKRKKRASGEQKEAGKNHPVQWVEAVLPEQPRVSEKASPLIVQFGGGVRMEIADQKGAILAAEVLRQLGETRGC